MLVPCSDFVYLPAHWLLFPEVSHLMSDLPWHLHVFSLLSLTLVGPLLSILMQVTLRNDLQYLLSHCFGQD